MFLGGIEMERGWIYGNICRSHFNVNLTVLFEFYC